MRRERPKTERISDLPLEVLTVPDSDPSLVRRRSDPPSNWRRGDSIFEARPDRELATEDPGDGERSRIVEAALPADFDVSSTRSNMRGFSRTPPRWLPPTSRRPPSVSLGWLRSRSRPRRGIGPMYLSVVVRS